MGGLRRLAAMGLGFALLAGSPAQAEIRAVLIGVGHYAGPGVPSLQGPKNDIAAMRRLLAAQGAADVVALQDEAVTRSTVREAVAAMGRRAKPGDWVIFYYSGHGSQAKARDRDETDGLDEFLLLGGFDHTRPDPETFIVDNDLNAWLATLLPASVNVLQIADSCHSGTLNRSYEAPTNFVAREARPQGATFVLPVVKGEAAPKGGPPRNLVYIGASQDDQFALEAPMPGAASDSRGLLTYSLEQALQDRRADGGLAADGDGDGELSFAELAGVLEVKTRELSRARQWASVRVPAGNEATAVFKPLRPRAEAGPSLSVAAGDKAAETLLTGGDWRLAAPGKADIVWSAGTGEVFDAQGDRIAEAIVGREAFAGVVDKRRALARLQPLARETRLQVEIGPRRRGERYRPGEPVALEVSSREAGGYLTAFNLAGDGTVQRLYPLEGDGDGRVEPGRVSLTRTHAAAPFGADHVVAVVTPNEPKALRAALARMEGGRQALAAAEAVRDAAVGPAQLALGELHTGR